MSGGFTLLWSRLLRSSIWVKESKETRLVWIALLALKDKDGEVQSSLVGLADMAKVSREECEVALGVLTGVDPDDSSGVDDGRRLRVIPGGWQVVNHELYRYSTDAQRAKWALEKAAQRAAQRGSEPRSLRRPGKPGVVLPGTGPTALERVAGKAEASGDVAGYDRCVTASLPEKCQ